MGKKGFKDLIVWQRAKDLAILIYKMTESEPFKRDYCLRDQLRRSAISIPSNIAEGDERATDKEAVRFFYIAKGSLAELRTQLEIAFEIGYIEKNTYDEIDRDCINLGKMIGQLIKVRSKNP